MNMGAIFASAFARRVAFVVVGVLCALLAQCFSIARAQSGEHSCASNRLCTSRQAAYQAAVDYANDPSTNLYQACLPPDREVINRDPRLLTSAYQARIACTVISNGNELSLGGETYRWTVECPPGDPWNEALKVCGDDCEFDDPPLSSGHVQCSGSSFAGCPYTVCEQGCGYDQPGGGLDGYVIDGNMWVVTTGWMPRGQSCSVGSTPGLGTPPADADGDGTSDGNDVAPNNPGSGGGGGEGGLGQPEDGSSSCGGPGQPACAEDGSNEGSGKGNTSGGGGNCQTPPSSTGDAILAQIAYQAWATRCAVEAQGLGGPVTGPGEGDGDQPGWTEGNGPANPEDTSAQDIDDASDWGIGLSADLLNTENIFGNSSCPALPSFSIMGYEIDTSAFSWWCTLISIMRAAILIMGAFTAIQILLRGF